MLVLRGDRADGEYWSEVYAAYAAMTPDALRRVFSLSSLHRSVLDFMPRGRLLDAGCGIGVMSVLADHREIVGIDVSAEQIEAARRLSPGAEFHVGSVVELPFPDRSFDGYLSLSVFEFLGEGLVPALREAARVLRPGGRLFVAVHRIPVALRLSRRGTLRTTSGEFRFERIDRPLAGDPSVHGYHYSGRELLAAAVAAGLRRPQIRRFDALGGFIHSGLAGRVIGAEALAWLTRLLERLFTETASPLDRRLQSVLLEERGPIPALVHPIYAYWNALIAERDA